MFTENILWLVPNRGLRKSVHVLQAMHVFHQHSLVCELLPTAIAAPQIYLKVGTKPFNHTDTDRLYAQPLKYIP